MKKLLFGCAIAAMGWFAPQATAMDNCCPGPCDPCCMDFNGFYVGGNVGVYSHIVNVIDVDLFFTGIGDFTVINTDVTAGVQLGYDWQCNNKLVGLVVDWNWVNGDNRLNDNTTALLGGGSFRNRDSWFTTIRARAGIAVCDALLYVTGGAVVHRAREDFSRPAIGTTVLGGDFREHRSRWGWTAGVGTEFLVWCNWSLGAEVLFMHFSERTRSFSIAGLATPFRFGFSDSLYVGRILLNYRFGDLCSCW